MLSNICLKTIQLPPKLHLAIKFVILSENKKRILKDGGILSSYLMKRDRPSELFNRNNSLISNDDILNDEVFHKELFDKKWQKDLLEFKIIVYKRRHALAYLASRLNATYGAIYRVFKEIRTRLPEFDPETILDFGSGLGTSFWVIEELWGLENKIMHHIDISSHMLETAKQLREAAGQVDEGFNVSLRENEYLPTHGIYDIVVASYTLGEIPSTEMMRKILLTLWKQAKHFLILIEGGSKAGYLTLMDCRDLIIKEMNQDDNPNMSSKINPIFAPCPHTFTCPLKEEGGCFFKQRTDLSVLQNIDRYYKFVTLKSHFNEKFCYLILSKQKLPQTVTNPYSRLIAPTLKRKHHIICQTCTANGTIGKPIFTKSKNGEYYKLLRKNSEWGDIIVDPATDMNINIDTKIEPQIIAT